MGVSHSVYLANDSSDDIYVIASLSPEWAFIDFVTDVGLLALGAEEIKSVVTAAELPETLATLRDLYEFIKIAAKLLGGTISVGTRPADAALALIDAFKKTSIRIPVQDHKKVDSEGFFSIYLNADGVASLAGAKTISLMVMQHDGSRIRLAMWDTEADDSWIATGDGLIVRSKYGTLWEQDPGAGTVEWPYKE
ncbi:hypothetical protein MMYC01_201715 [Madurella mycetomatis]|uniref:Uncharacterized protein n=1 Tax=Madurella mycetomatis TaxID=100816 RepID=A0A175WFD8_9PEZI|nr:hypothetical protein MMYC01_201715 [Madurella mycetomatis]